MRSRPAGTAAIFVARSQSGGATHNFAGLSNNEPLRSISFPFSAVAEVGLRGCSKLQILWSIIGVTATWEELCCGSLFWAPSDEVLAS